MNRSANEQIFRLRSASAPLKMTAERRLLLPNFSRRTKIIFGGVEFQSRFFTAVFAVAIIGFTLLKRPLYERMLAAFIVLMAITGRGCGLVFHLERNRIKT